MGLFGDEVDGRCREGAIESNARDTESDAAVCICDFMARDFKRL